MKIIKTCLAAAGIAALAACGTDADENNLAADANLVVTDNLEAPVDNLDMNVDTNLGNDLNNVADNTTDNTVNSY